MKCAYYLAGLAMVAALLGGCQTSQNPTTSRAVAAAQFNEYAGCWVEDDGVYEDKFCISESTNQVPISFLDRQEEESCRGIGTISALPAGGFLINQPEADGGCVEQVFECYPTNDGALSCENRFLGRANQFLFNRICVADECDSDVDGGYLRTSSALPSCVGSIAVPETLEGDYAWRGTLESESGVIWDFVVFTSCAQADGSQGLACSIDYHYDDGTASGGHQHFETLSEDGTTLTVSGDRATATGILTAAGIDLTQRVHDGGSSKGLGRPCEVASSSEQVN